jgi:HD superfamily phosphohydrolase
MEKSYSEHEWLGRYKHEITVHDPIHGPIDDISPELWVFIDTPEFQRLREIQQTGNTRYVYPGAEHTRFAHCLGVAHLCSVLAKSLNAKIGYVLAEGKTLKIN